MSLCRMTGRVLAPQAAMPVPAPMAPPAPRDHVTRPVPPAWLAWRPLAQGRSQNLILRRPSASALGSM